MRISSQSLAKIMSFFVVYDFIPCLQLTDDLLVTFGLPLLL